MQWTGVNDLFSFRARTESLEILLNLERPTKRQLLQLAMSIFDPLGLVALISILARILLRNVCRYKVDIDDKLLEDLIPEWQRTVMLLRRLQSVTIPRWHGTRDRNVDLHVFGDASENAFAAAAYVVFTQEGKRKASLCYAKAKVAPLKCKSIPRLELDAAVMAVRLMDTVISSNCWDVSRVVMCLMHWMCCIGSAIMSADTMCMSPIEWGLSRRRTGDRFRQHRFRRSWRQNTE